MSPPVASEEQELQNLKHEEETENPSHHHHNNENDRKTKWTVVIFILFFLVTLSFSSTPTKSSGPLEETTSTTNQQKTSSPKKQNLIFATPTPTTSSKLNTNDETSPPSPSSSPNIRNKQTNTNNNNNPFASLYGEKLVSQTCPQNLEEGREWIAKLLQKVGSSSSSVSFQPSCAKSKIDTNGGGDIFSQMSETERKDCADSWLRQCWVNKKNKISDYKYPQYTHSEALRNATKCDPDFMRHYILWYMRMPKRNYVWRANAPELFTNVRSFLKHDEFIMKAECDEILQFSKYLCVIFAHRELDTTFKRGSIGEEEENTDTNNKKKPKLLSATISNQFNLYDDGEEEKGYKIKVLEAIEGNEGDPATIVSSSSTSQQQQQLNNNNKKKRKRRGTEIDLITSGMFLYNVEFGAERWSLTEQYYLSKYEFRNRHFFQWNSIRDSRIRLYKAKRLYGEELKKRMDAVRNEVIKRKFYTWLTFDIDSGPANLSLLSELFNQVMILRLLGANYLLFIDQEAKQMMAATNSANNYRNNRDSLADYFVWTRPDLSFHYKRLTHIIRHPDTKEEGDAIELMGKSTINKGPSKRIPYKSYFLRSDIPTNVLYLQEGKGSNVMNRQKVTDILMIGNATGLIHLYRFVTSVLNSCVYVPFPPDYFVEFYLKLGADDYFDMHPVFLQFGAWIERGGTENATLPPTEMPNT